jgi:hypothetical protein
MAFVFTRSAFVARTVFDNELTKLYTGITFRILTLARKVIGVRGI